jgi:hypothetical protein
MPGRRPCEEQLPMTVQRLFAIALIIVGTGVAWFILGGSVAIRTGASDARLAREVEQIWGGTHRQVAPTAWYERTRVTTEPAERDKPEAGMVAKTLVDRLPIPIVSSRIDAALDLDQRRKGLLWYDTYGITFSGRYLLRNTAASEENVFVHFDFPSRDALYDAFILKLDGHDVEMTDPERGLSAHVVLPAGGEVPLEVSYKSRGLGTWTYAFSKEGVAQVHDFEIRMTTDCDGIDFPAGGLSPSQKTREGEGWFLDWKFDNLVTGQHIGIDLPNRLNPGPVAARIIFFAPVSLLFFVTVLMVLGILSGESLHPMHFFFLSAGFFAFHLLLAYLVDHLDIHLSFLISAAVSVLLVVTYLAKVAGMKFAVWRAGVAQIVFLVLFSYAFFFEGYSGLTVTVGSVLTLFVLMQATARVDWNQVFKPGGGGRVPAEVS